MLISVELFAKYVIIIYALGSVHGKFRAESKPLQIEIGVPN